MPRLNESTEKGEQEIERRDMETLPRRPHYCCGSRVKIASNNYVIA